MAVYSTVYSGADQRIYQSSTSLAFVRGIHRSPVNSPHKWPVTRKMFPFADVIMKGKPNIIKHWATMTWCTKIVPSAKPLIAKYVLYHTLNYVLLDAITIAGPSITMGVLLHDRCWNKLLASKYGLSGLFRKNDISSLLPVITPWVITLTSLWPW